MASIPQFLLDALQFREPRWEALRDVRDSEWEAVLSSWKTVRLTLPLQQNCGDYLPDWVRARIDGYLSDNALRFERIKSVYSRVAKALNEAGAKHVVVKGFSLWPGYSDHPRLRPQSDIDLYCPPESILRARDALIELGYTPDTRQEHLPKDHLCTMVPNASWEWRGNFFDPEIPVSFELHYCFWNSFLMHFSPSGLEDFWQRRIVREVDELSFPGLDPADNLGYTALNILRDLFAAVPTTEQVYGLARFLHTQAEDQAFWQRWRELHEKLLVRLETISFRLASQWFGCRFSEEVQEEISNLPLEDQRWFKKFSNPCRISGFGQGKNAVWLHLNFIDSHCEKLKVLLHALFPDHVRQWFEYRHYTGKESGQELPSNFNRVLKYRRWCVHRILIRSAKLPFFVWHGLRWLVSSNLNSSFWTLLGASLCFDVGLSIFFFLYNLFLLDRGFKEEFLGAITSALSIGSIACTIPAGMIINRFGIRKSLLLCFLLVPSVSLARVLVVSNVALLSLAFLGGMVTTIWAVVLSPALTQLTNEKNRPLAFSIVFSCGIGMGVLANLVASHMPGWLGHMHTSMTLTQLKQIALIIGCAITALGVLPVSRLRFAPTAKTERKIYPRNPFLLRFLPAVALWALVAGSLSPLANVYFSQYLRMPLERIGVVFSLSSLLQVLAILTAPLLFRKFGFVSVIASTQLAACLILGGMALTSGNALATMLYVGYTGALWMGEPGLFSLVMSRVAPGERAGASALNFLVMSSAQAIAVAVAGASFTRIGYPTALAAMAGVALVSAVFFRWALGKDVICSAHPSVTPLNSNVSARECVEV